ncbi:hypothetical protein M9980_07105 [Sphingomonas donggukensis]|uniref:DUF2157 domain-containing protein n=1 Tax=Sphingomonas donggukensis TaxID=2949093 RepID=A0ABY4TZ78_9SPHN|nr:hypothetical protein [Sphingomonas donggukensis]URW76951.1 hypothetical protein M9980_07105 [Sphingomonas donggukensis]
MYSEQDLMSAVEAGAITPDAAAALRNHIAATRGAPSVDEEQFRLLTGFNDIFVAIASALLLAAVGWIGGSVWSPLGGAAVAAVAWGLAEYFTRERRMALPSILLLLAFVGGVAATLAGVVADNGDALGRWIEAQSADRNVQMAIAGTIAAVIAGVAAFAAWLHWRRFMVPITVAAGAVAVVGVVMSLIVGLIPPARDAIFPLVLVAGIAMFAFAMRWDISDRERRTRRSDVAFWLHLAAAPMIAHSVFHMLGVFDARIGVGMAVIVVALYVAFAIVALAVDRRALLVSSLAYVLYALVSLFETAGAVELSAAFTGLVIGSALLLLSAFWHRARGLVVGALGTIAGYLPPVQQPRLAHV